MSKHIRGRPTKQACILHRTPPRSLLHRGPTSDERKVSVFRHWRSNPSAIHSDCTMTEKEPENATLTSPSRIRRLVRRFFSLPPRFPRMEIHLLCSRVANSRAAAAEDFRVHLKARDQDLARSRWRLSVANGTDPREWVRSV